MTAFNDIIDTSLPAGDDDPAEADDNMRRIQGGFQELGNVEHDYALTGTEITGDGTHKDITPTSVTNSGNNSCVDNAVSGNETVTGTLDVTGNIDPTTYETTNGGFLDEDDMASDANDKVVSQQSIKAYADLDSTGSVQHDAEGGFSNCDVNSVKTKVYTKYFSGNLDPDNETDVAHGVASGLTKILHVSASVVDDTTGDMVAYDYRLSTISARSYGLVWDGTSVTFDSVGANLQGNAYVIKVDYIL